MYTIKDICTWYDSSPNTIKNELIEHGIVQMGQRKGKGNKKKFKLEQLRPLFNGMGWPAEVVKRFPTMQNNPPKQLNLF
ncbi:MAG: hypothetical protein HOP30_19540 [Cyclobacteriaceae bacterium]|nr:hypothetical protein [Cyclobacteriaceae bacterium]